jgi:hypothetical protein
MELCLAGLVAGFLEEDVVVGVGVERRVEIDEINLSIREDFPVGQPFQIVAEQQAVHGRRE